MKPRWLLGCGLKRGSAKCRRHLRVDRRPLGERDRPVAGLAGGTPRYSSREGWVRCSKAHRPARLMLLPTSRLGSGDLPLGGSKEVRNPGHKPYETLPSAREKDRVEPYAIGLAGANG